MAALKLKKMTWLRKRFAKSEALSNALDWMDVSESMKDSLLTSSSFQLVEAQKSIIEMNVKTGNAAVLIEVVGVPSTSIQTIDVGPSEALVYEYPMSVFDVDFLTLNKEASAIMAGIDHPLEEAFHIVFDGTHLALHFFIQKDYIQTT